VEDCDGILARVAPYTAEVLRAGKELKVIARYGVGVDCVDLKVAKELGIWVTNAPLSNAITVAEHTMGLVIACAKNIVKCDVEFRHGDFDIRNKLIGMDLNGKTLGIIGLGRIGSRVAKQAIQGFDMKVIGYDPYISKDQVMPEIEFTQDREYLFKNSDIVTLHLPATEESKKGVGKKEFEMMKASAYLINCSRGEVVDEEALYEALRQKKIAGAGLDVFEQEPPAKDNKLFELENVIVSPHNAGVSRESSARMSLHAAQGIDEVLSGKKPTWPVICPD
jgi:D-3-phosphoglycerate dehydrogenase